MKNIISTITLSLLMMLSFTNLAKAAITDGIFGINQIFDVQYYWSGSTLNASNFIAPYDMNFQTVTATTGQYFQFFPSTTQPGTYGLKLMNSDGTLDRVVHNHGDITALGEGAIFYIGSGFFGNVISTAQGYSYGSSGTFTNMDTSVTSSDLQNYTYASNTVLTSGQTAAPSTPTVNLQSVNSLITNIYPTSNNSPSGETSSQAVDGNSSTKYLNFDKESAGFTVQLSAGKVVKGIRFTTANDFSLRDPTSFTLYGSNDGVNWTAITTGQTISLSDSRYWTSPDIAITNANAYVFYFITFPTLKSSTDPSCQGVTSLACDSVQIAEVTLLYDANDTTTSTNTGTGTVTNPGSIPTPTYASSINPVQVMTRASALLETTGNNLQLNIVGNNNDVNVQQLTAGNYANIDIQGSFNNVDTLQTSTISGRHYMEMDILGNNNTVNINQKDAAKTLFFTLDGNYNEVDILQQGAGESYIDLNVVGDDGIIDIVQEGAGDHAATIELENAGGIWNFSLTQSSNTNLVYSLPHDLSDNSVVSGVCYTGTCNLVVNQTE